jgi:hypothetical protein
VYFRSPAPERSWVTEAGAVLDSAALAVSVLDVDKPQPDAELCIRSGYLAFRRIGDYFLMPYDPDPTPDLPIAITREEFDEACQRLADAGATLKADRDQAWHDFAGWRVTYEGPLLRFASLCMAPPAPWSSDRPIHFNRLPVTRRHARARLHTHRGKRLSRPAAARRARRSPITPPSGVERWQAFSLFLASPRTKHKIDALKQPLRQPIGEPEPSAPADAATSAGARRQARSAPERPWREPKFVALRGRNPGVICWAVEPCRRRSGRGPRS